MKDLVIFGAGGLAREVAFLIEDINSVSPTWRIVGFVVTDAQQLGKKVGKYTVAYTEDELIDKDVAAAIGVGNPGVREKIANRFVEKSSISFPNIIHPSTIMDKVRIEMDMGNIICAGNIFTTDIRIGSFNLFNLNCTYGHDIQIGCYCVFNPGVNISGGVRIGSGCMIGTGATILQYLNIGEHATVGAGSVVSKHVVPEVTVVGIPARPVPSKADQRTNR